GRVEVHDDRLARQVLQGDLLLVLIKKCERRCLVTVLQLGHLHLLAQHGRIGHRCDSDRLRGHTRAMAGPSTIAHHERSGEGAGARVHLVDGTYELFRHFFGQPPHAAEDGTEVGATRGVLLSVLSLLSDGATHVGVATDHVIESFRNQLWPGYKTGEGVDPVRRGQFDLLEESLEAFGVVVWASVELEADDALA